MNDYIYFLNEGLDKQSNKIYNELSSYLKGEKSNSPELQYTFKEIFKSALTDLNDHEGSSQVDNIFPNAKLDTTINTDKSKEYFLGKWGELGREYAKIAKWDSFYVYQAFDKYAKKHLSKFDILSILDESINTLNEEMFDFVRDMRDMRGMFGKGRSTRIQIEDELGRELTKEEADALIKAKIMKVFR